MISNVHCPYILLLYIVPRFPILCVKYETKFILYNSLSMQTYINGSPKEEKKKTGYMENKNSGSIFNFFVKDIPKLL